MVNHEGGSWKIVLVLLITAKSRRRVAIHHHKSIALRSYFRIRYGHGKVAGKPSQVLGHFIVIECESTNSILLQPERQCHLGSDAIAVRPEMREYSCRTVLNYFFSKLFEHPGYLLRLGVESVGLMY